jgi:molybdenum cofactor cytidylyltransferase
MAITRRGVKGPVAAIVLAAGAGRRFGGGKLTAPWRGGVLLDGALTAALRAPADRVVLTVGADPAVAAAARACAERLDATDRLELVGVEGWDEGLAASLRTAVQALAPEVAAAFVFLGDMPAIPPDLPAALLAAMTNDVDAAAPEIVGDLGHPVLIAADLFPALADLRGDRGARALLLGLGIRLARVPTSERGVLMDVDTPAALADAQS